VTTASSDPVAVRAVWTPLVNWITVGLLALLAWGVTSETRPGLGGSHLYVLVLLVIATGSWLAWMAIRRTGPPLAGAIAITTMAIAGGLLVPYAHLGVVFVAVAALWVAISWPLPVALAVTAGGVASMLAGLAVTGHSPGIVLAGLAASLVGMVMGITRKQAVEQAQQAVLVSVEKERADVERARAELLGERNHLAREIHDVLAHTLAALSLQLEAFDTVAESDPSTSPAIREQLDRTRHLVHEGLEEARSAVNALRETALPIEEQLAKLCAKHGADFKVEGDPRPLPGQASLSLYRVTQEALTNVLKHAPGAPAHVHLCFGPSDVSLRVDNGPARSVRTALSVSGGGHGLEGIRERLALLDGRLEAGPSGTGWAIEVELPYAR
jgi:signal transduction histidine kinase